MVAHHSLREGADIGVLRFRQGELAGFDLPHAALRSLGDERRRITRERRRSDAHQSDRQ
jgi:hypothetical protein